MVEACQQILSFELNFTQVVGLGKVAQNWAEGNASRDSGCTRSLGCVVSQTDCAGAAMTWAVLRMLGRVDVLGPHKRQVGKVLEPCWQISGMTMACKLADRLFEQTLEVGRESIGALMAKLDMTNAFELAVCLFERPQG
ncbi:F-box and associated interaction domains-containing protein [Striga asiatica]|uniref:F-box and associated interaction domains-containing protein n=1 Tax=Striga asiatica TaxID=4170 RepID=A0A5A7RFI1_STRAF|nr:F-box and associated interaction domains-containing protein [Striga asiatica]